MCVCMFLFSPGFVVMIRSEDETLRDGCSTPDHQPAGENDQEKTVEESNRLLQVLGEENCRIASPILKGIPGPDLESAVLLLGNKYNDLIKKHEEKMAELSMANENCEIQRKKCTEECEPKYEILKKKFAEERAERKRLYNEIIELKGNIRVFCRCRPLSSEEISKGCSSVVEFNPSQDAELQIISADSSKKQFKFDHVLGRVRKSRLMLRNNSLCWTGSPSDRTCSLMHSGLGGSCRMEQFSGRTSPSDHMRLERIEQPP